VKFKDPGFQYGVALTKTAGRITMRMANADVLPFDFSTFYKTVNDYATEVKTLLETTRTETETENKVINEKLYDLAQDPKKPYKSPSIKAAVPFLDFSKLENTLVQLKDSADAFQKLYSKSLTLPVAKQKELNSILYQAERSLIYVNGLPRRPWYKHEIYAPGYYTGYGVKTLPGIREAIEQRNWKEAQESIEIVAKALQSYVQQIQQATVLLTPKAF
jgi:N-acetylated-alpha-linked acidic dipeptidase